MRPAAILLFAATFCPTLTSCRAEPDDASSTPRPPPRRPAAPPPAIKCESDKDPALGASFRDDFDRTELGPDWNSTSYGAYLLRGGRLCIAKPRNHPLWLKKKLPTNVRVEFEATPLTANGDVKVEVFGDGCSFDQAGREYLATSYVAVLGAHANAEHWLTRLDEHGEDGKRTPLSPTATSIQNGKLTANTKYKVELSRTDGKELRFIVDGVLVHAMTDEKPLDGQGHDHFAFSGWEAGACFDNLVITGL